MRKIIILTALLLLSAVTQSQTVEEFNQGTSWMFNNGAGIQNYGTSENYASFNIGGTPYLNSRNIIIRSPIEDYTNCSELTASFPIYGIVEDGWDIMRFQYKDGGIWITDTAFTGFVDMTYTSGILPNTLTRFRFKLTTDGSVNTYWTQAWHWWWGWYNDVEYVYIYDIASFTTFCPSTLPVDLLRFYGYEYMSNGMIYWVTATEVNNDRFELYHSMDAMEWEMINNQLGHGNSNVINEYFATHKLSKGVNYYQLKQIDYDGQSELFDIISISYNLDNNIKEVFYNILGQPVDVNYKGLKISNLNNKNITK